MGFRFRKSLKLLPGIRINLSKSGVSASIGRPGATVNISERGSRTTVGIPGTGISYSENHSAHPSPPMPEADPKAGMSFFALLGWGIVLLFVGLLVFG